MRVSQIFSTPARRRVFVALTAICLLSFAAWVLPRIVSADLPRRSSTKKIQKPNFVPGEILVRFRPTAAAAITTSKPGAQAAISVQDYDQQLDLRVEQLNSGSEIVSGLRLAHVAPDSTLDAVAALRKRSDVIYAEPNYLRRKAAVPNDSRYSEQWALKNTGQVGGSIGADIKAEQAWNITTGSNSVVVGVIDEGIDVNHPDLQANIWVNPGETAGNNVDDDGNGLIDDVNGWDFAHNDKTVFDGNGTYPADETDAHGTHVAGTIGATGNNGTGVVGVNWQVRMISLKFLGAGGEGSTANLLKALTYVKTMRDLWSISGGTKGANIKILNNSYTGTDFSQAELDAIRILNDAGILFVAAAGNDHLNNDLLPQYPANYNVANVISVAASTRNDGLASFSDFGLRTVHLAAPGVDVLSTTPNNTYEEFEGTSMASPHVAGAAALVLAVNPNISVQRLKAALVFGGEEKSFGGTISSRRLSAFGALQNATEVDVTPPANTADFHIISQSGREITVRWTAPGDDNSSGRASAYELRFADSDLSSATQFDEARRLIVPRPENAGFVQSATVRIPYQHLSGFVGLRAIDNAGNAGAVVQVPVSVSQDIADPYLPSESAPATLSSGGTPLNLKGDDRASDAYTLPFAFRYYNQAYTSVYISTNGAIYFAPPPGLPFDSQHPFENVNDFNSSIAGLNTYQMIAGLWDDLRTDQRSSDDVYVVTPDSDRIIFRWQTLTFNTLYPDGTQRGEHPVNFEIELRRDGTIKIRYGNGNENVTPIVGISNSEPDAYLSTSHTSDIALRNLTNAPEVTYALRNPPPPPSADVQVTVSPNPNPAISGQNLTYSVVVRNVGPENAPNVTLTNQLPVGVTFVSCTTSVGSCSGPPLGSTGTVNANIGLMSVGSFSSQVTVNIVVNVTAAPATNLVNTATATSPLLDNNLANNSVTRVTGVVESVNFSGVRAISAGGSYSAVVRTDGTVWTWGQNFGGQLGNGTLNSISTPAQVGNISNAVGVSAGTVHTLVNLSDGTVLAWGTNSSGVLGDGTTTNRFTPGLVSNLNGVIAVGASNFFSVALKSDGTVWWWGTFLSPGNQTVPVQLPGLTDVKSISVGSDQVLALRNDGTVWSWGGNQYGQLGDGTTTFRLTPGPIPSLSNVVSVSAGGNPGGDAHSLAVKGDGTVWAWGSNFHMQTGLAQADFTPHPTPLQVNGISGAVSAAAGGKHSAVVKSDGTVWTWGDNNRQQLGHPANCCAFTPAPVGGLGNVQAMDGGYSHNLVLLTDGSMRSWGDNTDGALGDGTTTHRPNPVNVSGLSTVSLPLLSPDGGEYSSSQNVTLSCATSGAVIRYTINGNDPTESDQVIASGSTLQIDSGKITVVKVKAWKDGWIPSAVKTATYSIFTPTATTQLSANSLNVTEGAGTASMVVTRSGNTSSAATVNYATSDTAALNECNVVNGAGSSRCDYVTSIGTLRFAAGETSKTIFVPIVDDGYAEGNESFTITLSSPTGMTLGTTTSATVTIQDNDSSNGANPLDETDFFIRQQYIDFLGREPDPAGLAGWRNVLNNCGTTVQQPCDRIEVSAGFFRSEEFQSRGYFIYRFFSALGRIPVSEEFYPDFAKVSGFLTPEQLEANKVAYVNEVMARADFQTKYGATLNNPTAYVEALLQTVGFQAHPAKNIWINNLTASNTTQTRGQVLRELVESAEVYNKYYNEAFVIMQYFGYLRRTADASYLSWINTMNQSNGDYRTMINGFMNSTEYRRRFGP